MADVMEANRSTAVRAVEALLVETEPKLRLNSEALAGLDDAGLDHDIIDLLVAQSFPDRFVIERRGRRGTWSSRQTGDFRDFGGFGGRLREYLARVNLIVVCIFCCLGRR